MYQKITNHCRHTIKSTVLKSTNNDPLLQDETNVYVQVMIQVLPATENRLKGGMRRQKEDKLYKQIAKVTIYRNAIYILAAKLSLITCLPKICVEVLSVSATKHQLGGSGAFPFLSKKLFNSRFFLRPFGDHLATRVF